MASSLSGKTALVTGGCGGLGQAISKAFLEAGANVVACDYNPSLVHTFAEDNKSEKLLALECDITKDEALTRLFDEAKAMFGEVSIVVNNAGIMDRFEGAGTLGRDLWDRVIATNLTAPYAITKLAVNHMLEKKIPGSIINISSAGGIHGGRAGAAYTSSKHGVVGLTKNTASYYAKDGIRCNALLPGGMETNIGASFANGYDEYGMSLVMKTMATSCGQSDIAHVAGTVVFLASDTAGALNGACIPIDRGWTAS